MNAKCKFSLAVTNDMELEEGMRRVVGNLNTSGKA
jgi:hypothetical protein